MEESASTKTFTWKKVLAVLGVAVTIFGLVGTIFTISGGVRHGDAILRALRANIPWTGLVLLINEQGEKE